SAPPVFRRRGQEYKEGVQPISLIAKVIAQRRGRTARLAAVGLPVAPVLVALQRADAEADLALRRAQLDDLHLIGLVHFEVDLLAAVRVVELRHVNQPLDAVGELDEGAEVRHPDDLAIDDRADLDTAEELVP